MSTRALIAKKTPTGYVGIYLNHSDVDTLAILRGHYAGEDSSDRLLELGNLSKLTATPDPEVGTRHSFDNPEPGITIAYGRDRGEDHQERKHRAIFAELRNSYAGIDNTYIFRHGQWVAFGVSIEDGCDLATSQAEEPRAHIPDPDEAILKAADIIAENATWIITQLKKTDADEELIQAFRALRAARA